MDHLTIINLSLFNFSCYAMEPTTIEKYFFISILYFVAVCDLSGYYLNQLLNDASAKILQIFGVRKPNN